MAGSNAGFDADGFRDNIRLAMAMGAAPDVENQVAFHFPSQLVYNASADGAHVPFDPAATITRTEPPPVRVDCAVQYVDEENQPSSFGLLAPSRLIITLLDEEYAKVKHCSYVVAQGDRYDYRRTEPPSGLFDVGVFTMHFTSPSDT